MKRIVAMLILLLAFHPAVAPAVRSAAIPVSVPKRIELRDQFDHAQLLTFPSTNVVFLTIADKKGSEQISAWVQPTKLKFGTNIQIRGIADVSSVPRPLQGFIRKQFQKIQSYPIMMDWNGDMVKAITYVPEKANILVLDGSGQIAARMTGPATEAGLAELFDVLDKVLKNRADPRAGPGR